MSRFKGTIENTRPWSIDAVRFQSDGPARPPWWQAQIDDPVYVPAAQATFMRPDDYVIGLVHGRIRKAYSLWILDYYHIVNDSSDSEPFVLFSCDRCQTGDAWLRRVRDVNLNFHFGGIHNCTLVGEDAQTGSKWLIADGVSVHGPMRGELLDRIVTYHATYKEWAAAFPDTLVLAPPADPAHRDKRHGHGCDEYYARAGISPLFPRTLGENPDLRLAENEMVLAVTHGAATRLYPLEELKRAGGVVHDSLGGEEIAVLCGPRADSFWTGAYYAKLPSGEGVVLENNGDAFLDQRSGSRFRSDGLCTAGRLEGQRLYPAQFSFLRFHGWGWGHKNNDIFQHKGVPARVDEGAFSGLLERLRSRGFMVDVRRSLLDLEQPNEALGGLIVRINGDRFKLHHFETRENATDYAFGRHALRSGLAVLESDPDLDLQFADAIHSRLRPDKEIPWSKLLEADGAGHLLRTALNEAFPETQKRGMALTEILQALIEKGHTVEIGKTETIDGFRSGRWVVETTRGALRVGCQNAIFGKIDGNPLILYKFDDADAAQRYLDEEEKHAVRFDRYVFRTTPDGMYFLRSGFGQLPDEQIPWSSSFGEPSFRSHVEEILSGKGRKSAQKKYSAPPPMIIDPRRQYRAIFKTEKGEFVADLAAKEAPVTVNNFVFLAREGYYDGTTFHMVLPGLYAQGGDPRGDGKGDPGYRFGGELSAELRHDAPGVLTMANRGAPNTSGSQFIVLFSPMPHLDGQNSAFGRITKGMEVVSSLRPRDAEWEWPDPPPGDRLLSVEIQERTEGR